MEGKRCLGELSGPLAWSRAKRLRESPRGEYWTTVVMDRAEILWVANAWGGPPAIRDHYADWWLYLGGACGCRAHDGPCEHRHRQAEHGSVP
jgi:hypothetical protein